MCNSIDISSGECLIIVSVAMNTNDFCSVVFADLPCIIASIWPISSYQRSWGWEEKGRDFGYIGKVSPCRIPTQGCGWGLLSCRMFWEHIDESNEVILGEGLLRTGRTHCNLEDERLKGGTEVVQKFLSRPRLYCLVVTKCGVIFWWFWVSPSLGWIMEHQSFILGRNVLEVKEKFPPERGLSVLPIQLCLSVWAGMTQATYVCKIIAGWLGSS